MFVNGRFLNGTPTGLHRAAGSLLRAATAAGLEADVWRPPPGGIAGSDGLVMGGAFAGRTSSSTSTVLVSLPRR